MIRFVVQDVFEFKSFFTLYDCSGGSIRHFQDFQNRGHCTYFVQVIHSRVFSVGVFLGNNTDHGILFIRVPDELQGFVPANIYRDNYSRK